MDIIWGILLIIFMSVFIFLSTYCKHDWKLGKVVKRCYYSGGKTVRVNHYVCMKCGELKQEIKEKGE